MVACPRCRLMFVASLWDRPTASLDRTMAAKRDDDADEDEPRPKKKRAAHDDEDAGERKKSTKKETPKSNLLLFGLIGSGVAVLLLGCLVTGVLAFVFWPKSGGSDKDGGGAGAGGGQAAPRNNPAVTNQTYNKIKTGQSRKEVEDLMGGAGEKIDLQEANTLLAKSPKFRDEPVRVVQPEIANRPDSVYNVWRNGSHHILVAFVTSKKYGDMVVMSNLHIDRGGGSSDGGHLSDNPVFVERERDRLEESMKVHNDPRWIKGQAKTLLIGSWGSAKKTTTESKYTTEFKSDGTLSLPGLGGFGAPPRTLGTYKFIDDEHIQYDVPPTKFNSANKKVYKVLVNEKELYLLERAEERFMGGGGPGGRYFTFRPNEVLTRLNK
jgi:hypothetical protein